MATAGAKQMRAIETDILDLIGHLESALEEAKAGRADPFCDDCAELLNKLSKYASGRIDDGPA